VFSGQSTRAETAVQKEKSRPLQRVLLGFQPVSKIIFLRDCSVLPDYDRIKIYLITEKSLEIPPNIWKLDCHLKEIKRKIRKWSKLKRKKDDIKYCGMPHKHKYT
jgi:hypothetical protein